MFLDLLDPDPSIFVRIRIRNWILQSKEKIGKKNLDLYCFFYDFFNDFSSLKNDLNVPSKSNKQKIKKIFFLASLRPLTKRAGSGSVS
jgi:hypothetical protein